MFLFWQPRKASPHPLEAKIRRLYGEGMPTKALGERFGLSQRRIQEILGADLRPRPVGRKTIHIPGRQIPGPDHPMRRPMFPRKNSVDSRA